MRFGGQSPEINVSTFISMIKSFSDVAQEVNKAVGHGQDIEIKIHGTKKGSFEVSLVLLLIETARQNLPLATNLLSSVARATCDIYKLRQWLANRQIAKTTKKDGDIILKDIKGDVFIIKGDTYTTYKNSSNIRNAVSSGFSGLARDKSVDSVSISESKKDLFTAKKEEFSELATKTSMKDAKVQMLEEEADLVISRIVFGGRKRKWGFIYSGHEIDARMEDQDFLGHVDQRKKFAKGDQLRVKLVIVQKHHPKLDVYLNSEYRVTKVIDHMQAGEKKQSSIF